MAPSQSPERCTTAALVNLLMTFKSADRHIIFQVIQAYAKVQTISGDALAAAAVTIAAATEEARVEAGAANTVTPQPPTETVPVATGPLSTPAPDISSPPATNLAIRRANAKVDFHPPDVILVDGNEIGHFPRTWKPKVSRPTRGLKRTRAFLNIEDCNTHPTMSEYLERNTENYTTDLVGAELEELNAMRDREMALMDEEHAAAFEFNYLKNEAELAGLLESARQSGHKPDVPRGLWHAVEQGRARAADAKGKRVVRSQIASSSSRKRSRPEDELDSRSSGSSLPESTPPSKRHKLPASTPPCCISSALTPRSATSSCACHALEKPSTKKGKDNIVAVRPRVSAIRSRSEPAI